MSGKYVFASALVAALLFQVASGVAENGPPLHRGTWPIYNGFNHQPTQHALKALHHRDVTPEQAREVDRLYDQLLSSSEKILRQHPAQVN